MSSYLLHSAFVVLAILLVWHLNRKLQKRTQQIKELLHFCLMADWVMHRKLC